MPTDGSCGAPPLPLPPYLDVPANGRVAEVLASRRLHAHAELRLYFEAQGPRTPGPAPVISYMMSADDDACSLQHTQENVVFLVLHGRRNVALRLPPRTWDEALEDGACHDPVLGGEWFAFEWPGKRLLGKWYSIAMAYASESVVGGGIDGIDMNAALVAYCHTMGNRLPDLERWASETGVCDRVEHIVNHIRDIQGTLFDLTAETAGDKRLPADELAPLVDRYAERYLEWIDDAGKTALLRWLGYVCWHEGLLSGPG